MGADQVLHDNYCAHRGLAALVIPRLQSVAGSRRHDGLSFDSTHLLLRRTAETGFELV